MLLKSIELENFRQFVNEKIDFSTDPNQNVTLIIGDNGTGKTTFEQAFFWCFYGETSFSDKNLLNKTVSKEILPNKIKTVKVKLKLRHGSADYEITRTQDYKKDYNNDVTPANSVLNISIKSENGNTRYLKPLECEIEIKNILPKELSNYFFFDGEHIENMSKEISARGKSRSFANAVTGLTGLNGILAALDHLSPTKTKSVIGQFNAAFVNDSDGKINKLTEEINELQEELNSIEQRLSEIDEEINAAEISKAKWEDDIKQYSDGEKLQNERERLYKELNAAKKTKDMAVKNLCSDFNRDMTLFFSISLVQRALNILSKSDFSGKDIPHIHTKTIKFLLKRGTCLCGTQLMEGSIPYNNLVELMNYLPPQSIGVTVGSFIRDARAQYIKEVDLFDKITDHLSMISSQEEIIEELSGDIAQISSKLEGDDVREQVKKINSRIKDCATIISNDKSEQQRLLKRQGAAETEKTLKETNRSKLALNDKNNKYVEICKTYALKIYNDLKVEYDLKEKEIREKLEKSTNDIFKTIYNGGLSLSIDENYNVSVFVNDSEGNLISVNISTAQSISVTFAFISAITKMAKDNQINTASEPYPLVMDAPFSAFDKTRIQSICSVIPKTAEQVIIFIKDTDGDLAEEHLGNKIKTRHRFRKIDEFNTEID